MVGLGPHQPEPVGSQRQDNFFNLERGRDREGHMHTTHTSKSYSRIGSHVSQEKHNRAMQLEIEWLKRKPHYARRGRTPSNSDVSSEGEADASYRRRSRTLSSESFSYDEEHHHRRRYKSPQHRGLGNDTMSKALNQISRSPFTRKIEAAILPRYFHPPTFTIYND